MTTNFLKFCTSSVDGLASVVGASCVECAVRLGRMCTWSEEGASDSGLLVARAVALGSNFVGSGLRLGF